MALLTDIMVVMPANTMDSMPLSVATVTPGSGIVMPIEMVVMPAVTNEGWVLNGVTTAPARGGRVTESAVAPHYYWA